jgi:hypothetical protein
MLIVSGGEARAAAREPGRSLVYFAGTDVNTRWDAGVPYRLAAARGWLLRDGAGNLLVNKGYPDNYVGDVGDPAYQQAWLANVLRFLRAHHDDGVYIEHSRISDGYIDPGETFEYRFTVRQSGTYWYHSHSGFQEQAGLYGPLVIMPREPQSPGAERDYVVMLSDWTDEDPQAILRKLRAQSPAREKPPAAATVERT